VGPAGGPRNATRPKKFALPVVELSAVNAEGLVEAKELFAR
jgi:hypothetical protein